MRTNEKSSVKREERWSILHRSGSVACEDRAEAVQMYKTWIKNDQTSKLIREETITVTIRTEAYE